MIYPWQQAQWQTFLLQQQQNKLPHALLLTGVRGMGKHVFAEYMAKTLLCETQHDRPCNQCKSCHLLTAHNHPDFFAVSLLEKSRAIKIDQIRALSEKLQQTSQYGGYQIAIINPADSMNPACANALLKTLEEPPGQVLIILVTEFIGKLPATIISRCQRYVFAPQDKIAIQQWLTENVNSSNSETLLKLAHGAPLMVKALEAQQCLKTRDTLIDYLQQLMNQQTNVVHVAATLVEIEFTVWLPVLLSVVNDIARLQQHVSQAYLVNDDRLEVLNAFAQCFNPLAVQYYLSELLNTYRLLQSQLNPNVLLQIESLFIQWLALRNQS